MRLSVEDFVKIVGREGYGVVNPAQVLDVAPESSAAAKVQHAEYDMQRDVVDLCKMRAALIAEYGLLFAVPNDMVRPDTRITPGLSAGVPDLFWPVARGGYCGMFIELKVGKNRLSAEQVQWMARLRAEGYHCVVVYDNPEAVIAAMETYRKLGGERCGQ